MIAGAKRAKVWLSSTDGLPAIRLVRVCAHAVRSCSALHFHSNCRFVLKDYDCCLHV